MCDISDQNPHISDVLIQAKTNVIANDYCEELTIGTIISTHVCAGEGMPNACSVSDVISSEGMPNACSVSDVIKRRGDAQRLLGK